MAYRSVASATGTGSTSMVGSLPAGTASGDRLLAFINVDDATTAWNTIPSGFASIGSQVHSAGNPDGGRFDVFEKKVATGSDGVTWVTTGSTADYRITIVSLTGRHSTAEATFATKTDNQTANSSPVSVSGSSGTAVSGDDIVVGALMDNTNAAIVIDFSSWSGSLVERSDPQASEWTSIGVATQDAVSAGAFGTVSVTATFSLHTAGWVLYAIAVPVASGSQSQAPRSMQQFRSRRT